MVAKAKIDKIDALSHYGLDSQKKTILIFGGSLGARTLNSAMSASESLLKSNDDVQWIWQAGKLYFDEYKDSETAKLSHVEIREFLERMEYAYAAADLVIARAGALKISEIELLGKAAILVPSPNVAEDQQTKNAMALVNDNAAEIVIDSKAESDLVSKGLELVQDDARLKVLAENVKSRGMQDAAEIIADEVLKLAER